MKFKTLCNLVRLINDNTSDFGIDYLNHYKAVVINESGFPERKMIDVDHTEKIIRIIVSEEE